MLDGASHPDEAERDGGWLADCIGRELHHRLATEPTAELCAVLRESIRHNAERYGLTPGRGPSTTVAIVRWTADHVDAPVLGDSPIAATTTTGELLTLRDDRLSRVVPVLRQAYQHAGPDRDERRAEWQRLVQAELLERNRAGGYWIAEADPDAAYHALTARWPIANLAAVLAVTDGVSVGVDRYRIPPDWPEAIMLARRDPARPGATRRDPARPGRPGRHGPRRRGVRPGLSTVAS